MKLRRRKTVERRTAAKDKKKKRRHRRAGYSELFKSSVSLLIFCLDVLSLIQGEAAF